MIITDVLFNSTVMSVVASEECLENLEDLELNIFEKTGVMMEMIKSVDITGIQEILLKNGTHNNPNIVYPKYDSKTGYYQQFWKMYLLNEIMINHIKECSMFNKQFVKIVVDLEEMQADWNRITMLRTKTRVRRTSDKIDKSFICPFDDCHKNYGTDVSLNLHMKIKHNSGTKSQREAVAKQICLAEERGETIQTDLKFPPGYLQEFKKLFKLGLGNRK